MNTIYFVTYIVTYFKFFRITRNTDVRVEGVAEIQAMQHVKNIEKSISELNKNRKVTITNFIPLMQIPEMKNPE